MVEDNPACGICQEPLLESQSGWTLDCCKQLTHLSCTVQLLASQLAPNYPYCRIAPTVHTQKRMRDAAVFNAIPVPRRRRRDAAPNIEQCNNVRRNAPLPRDSIPFCKCGQMSWYPDGQRGCWSCLQCGFEVEPASCPAMRPPPDELICRCPHHGRRAVVVLFEDNHDFPTRRFGCFHFSDVEGIPPQIQQCIIHPVDEVAVHVFEAAAANEAATADAQVHEPPRHRAEQARCIG